MVARMLRGVIVVDLEQPASCDADDSAAVRLVRACVVGITFDYGGRGDSLYVNKIDATRRFLLYVAMPRCLHLKGNPGVRAHVSAPMPHRECAGGTRPV